MADNIQSLHAQLDRERAARATTAVTGTQRMNKGVALDLPFLMREFPEVSPDVLTSNPDRFREEATHREMMSTLEGSPKTAEWLQNRRNSALAQPPEIAALTDVERFVAEQKATQQAQTASQQGRDVNGRRILSPSGGPRPTTPGRDVQEDPRMFLGGAARALEGQMLGTAGAMDSIAKGARAGAEEQVGRLESQITRLEEMLVDENVRADMKPGIQVRIDALREAQPKLQEFSESEFIPLEERDSFKRADALQSWTDETFGAMPDDPTFGQTLWGAAGGFAVFIAGGLIGGGSTVALMGANAGGQEAYDRAVQYGATEEEARLARGFGTLLGSTEAVPLTRAINRLKGPAQEMILRRIAYEMFIGGIEEGTQEFVAAVGQNLIAQQIYDPDQELINADVGEQALIGAILGAILPGAGGIGKAMITEPRRQEVIPGSAFTGGNTQAYLDFIGGKLEGTNVGGDPDAAESLIRKVTDDGDLFVPAVGIREFFQSRGEEIPFAQIGVSESDFGVMEETNGLLVVPQATWASKIRGTDFDAWFRENSSRSEFELSTAEMAAVNQEVESGEAPEIEAMRRRADEMESTQTGDRMVFEHFYRELTSAGENTDIANRQASLQQAYFSTLASRTNGKYGNAFELMQRIMPTVRRESFADQDGVQFNQDGTVLRNEAFNTWFGESKVLDDTGEPLLVYHGTQSDEGIAVFDEGRVGQRDSGFYGKGFYFTTDESIAGEYADDPDNKGGTILPVYLKMDNPYRIDLTETGWPETREALVNLGIKSAMRTEDTPYGASTYAMQNREAEYFSDTLASLGHDGIIVEGPNGVEELIAFDPTQIKSSNNQGTFDANDPRILFQGDAESYARRGAVETGAETGVRLVNRLASAAELARDNRFPTGRAFKEALQERSLAAQKEDGIDLTQLDAEAEARLTDYVFEDALEALQDNENAIGWYDRTVTAAKEELARIYPEILTDPESEFAFVWALAVTSNGLKVDKNFELAAKAYDVWKETGEFPSDIGIGEAAKGINNGLATHRTLVEKLGSWEAARDFMVREQTVRDVEKNSGSSISGEGKSEVIRGAGILGPKIGNGFFSNLYGHFDSLTMDRWLMRSVGRWRGTLIALNPEMEAAKHVQIREANEALSPVDRKAINALFAGADTSLKARMSAAAINKLAKEAAKRSMKPAWRKDINSLEGGEALRKLFNALAGYLDGQVEAPAGTKERAFLRRVFKKALARLEEAPELRTLTNQQITMADLQALLWYPEKLLYDSAKKPEGEEVRAYEDDDAPDYANAARKLVRNRLGSSGRDGAGSGATGSGNRAQQNADGQGEVNSDRRDNSDARGRTASGSLSPLEGAPTVRGVSGPDPRLVAVAEQYAAANGIELKRQSEFVEVDPERGVRIADAYEQMAHAPQDPAVLEAYENLIRQTVAQYEALVAAGYKFHFIDLATPEGEAYASSPWNAMFDTRDNQEMGVFSTAEGFGSQEDFSPEANPLLADTGFEWPLGPDGEMRPVYANDLFRAVHDAFGHGLEFAGFRAIGEENAWQSHVRLFTGSAVAAITTETRGQNSWLNYGPHGETNRTALVEDTVFADQKSGLLPSWAWEEGRAGDSSVEGQNDGQQQQTTTLYQGGFPVDTAGLRRGRTSPEGGVADTADGVSNEPVTEADLDRIDEPDVLRDILRRPGWGIVTANTDPSEFATSKEDGPVKDALLNRHADSVAEQQAQLRSALEEQGIPFVEVQGVYKGVPDGVSFFILADEQALTGFGKQFGQESVINSKGLVFTDRPAPNVPATGVDLVGPDAAQEDFSSTTPGGTSFSMGLGKGGPGIAVIPEGYTEAPGRPQLPVRPDGLVELHHWSAQQLTEIDPAFAGTGPLSGAERTRGAQVTFFGINPREDQRQQGTGYTKESSLGPNEHVALVEPDALYPFFEDPEGLATGKNIDEAETAIRAAGYLGYYVTDDGSGKAPLGNVATLFEAVPVEVAPTRDPNQTGAATTDEAFDTWFGDSKVVGENGEPLVVDHATFSEMGDQFSFEQGAATGVDKTGSNAFYFSTGGLVGDSLAAENSFGATRNVGKFYLSIQKPLDLTDASVRQNVQETWEGMALAFEEAKAAEKSTLSTLRDLNNLATGDRSENHTNLVAQAKGKHQEATAALTELKESGLVGLTDFRPDKMDWTRENTWLAMMAAAVKPNVLQNALSDWARSEGYDGVKFFDGGMRPDGKTEVSEVAWAAFDPTQIKSVDNKGTFDAVDPRTMFQNDRKKDPRASVTFGNGEAVFRLFEKSDWTSFLHESGHYFLEMQQQIANLPDTPQQIKDDWAVVSNWLGMDDGAAAISRDQHEKWADGTEAYLEEGKAPSLDLAEAFSRFRAWFKQVYSGVLRRPSIKVSPEIRDVMDRMFATDEQIAEAREAQSSGPLFATRPANMSEGDWTTHQRDVRRAVEKAERTLLERTMQKVRKRRSQAYRIRLREIEEEVEAEALQDRRYQVILALGDNKYEAQGWLSDERLNKAELVEAFGEKILEDLDRKNIGGRRNLWASKDGIGMDEVAEAFGFRNGIQMITDLRTTQPMKAFIKETAKDRIEAETPDPLNDGSIMEEALSAVHNSQQAAVVSQELVALDRQAGVSGDPALRSPRVYRYRARQMLRAMSVRDASNPKRFLAAERRASREAEKSFAQTRRDGSKKVQALAAARQAKEQQLLNHYLYEEAVIVQRQVERARVYATRFKKSTIRDKVYNGVDPADPQQENTLNFLDQIDNILEMYSFKKANPPGGRSNRQRMIDFWTRAVEQDEHLNMPPSVEAILKDETKHYSELTVEELDGVVDALRNLEAIGKRFKDVIEGRASRERKTMASTIAGLIANNIGTGRLKKDSLGRRTFNKMLSVDTMMVEIDADEMGPAYEGIKRKIDLGEAKLAGMNKEMAVELDKLFSLYNQKELDDMHVRRAVEGLPRAWSKNEILAVVLNMGNADNMNRLLYKGAHPVNRLTQAQIDKLLTTLDERDTQFVQGLWDYIDSFWGQIAEVEMRRTGVRPKKVVARPLQTKFGLLRGGYYPIKYDAALSSAAERDQQSLFDQQNSALVMKAQTANGHTVSRKKAGGDRTLELDLQVSFTHLNSVVRGLALSEAVDDASKLLAEPELRAAFREAGRPDDLKVLKAWLQDIATGPVRHTDGLNVVSRTMKTNFTMSRLALNLKTIALQATGVAQSAAVVGKRNLAQAYVDYGKEPSLAKSIMDKSTFMAERMSTFQKDIYDFQQNVRLEGPVSSQSETDAGGALLNITNSRAVKVLARGKNNVAKIGMAPMMWVQYHTVDVPTWIAGYKTGMKRFSDEAKAVAYADRMVARSQGSGLMADRSAIERGTLGENSRQLDWVKILTTLQSYMITKMNRGYLASLEGTRGVRSAETPVEVTQAIVKASTKLMLLYAFEAVAIAMAYSAMTDDEEPEDVRALMMAEMGSAVFGGFPVVRDVYSTFSGFGGGGIYGNLTETPQRVARQIQQGEADAAFWSATMGGIGLATGLPTTFLNRLMQGVGTEMGVADFDTPPSEALFGYNPLAN